MKIYRGRIEPTAFEIVARLTGDELIEVTSEEVAEVQKDVESVLTEYMRMEREITDRAKDIVSRRSMDYSGFGRLRRKLAAEKSFALDDEGLDYIVQQIIEILMSSSHVEEVFGLDHELNRVIVPIMRKHMTIEEELDKEVRSKLKHLSDAEGTRTWEIEYEQARANLERLKKLR